MLQDSSVNPLVINHPKIGIGIKSNDSENGTGTGAFLHVLVGYGDFDGLVEFFVGFEFWRHEVVDCEIVEGKSGSVEEGATAGGIVNHGLEVDVIAEECVGEIGFSGVGWSPENKDFGSPAFRTGALLLVRVKLNECGSQLTMTLLAYQVQTSLGTLRNSSRVNSGEVRGDTADSKVYWMHASI